jgi:hypothetical protein
LLPHPIGLAGQMALFSLVDASAVLGQYRMGHHGFWLMAEQHRFVALCARSQACKHHPTSQLNILQRV